jgi:hypothetical protein
MRIKPGKQLINPAGGFRMNGSFYPDETKYHQACELMLYCQAATNL